MSGQILKNKFSLSNKKIFLFLFLKLILVFLVVKGSGGALILGDSDLYDTYDYSGENFFNRTFFTIAIVWFVNIFSFGMAFVIFPIFLYVLIFYFLYFCKNNFVLGKINFVCLFLLPVGVIWSSILGKEVLFLIAFFIYAIFRLKNDFSSLFVCVVSVFVMVLLRSTYAVALVLIFEVLFFKKTSFIFYKNMFLYFVVALFAYVFFLFDYSEGNKTVF